MFLTDAKIQVSILTDFFFGNGPKINFLRKKSPNVAFFKKGGWLVGWLGLMGYFSSCTSRKKISGALRTPREKLSLEVPREEFFFSPLEAFQGRDFGHF